MVNALLHIHTELRIWIRGFDNIFLANGGRVITSDRVEPEHLAGLPPVGLVRWYKTNKTLPIFHTSGERKYPRKKVWT